MKFGIITAAALTVAATSSPSPAAAQSPAPATAIDPAALQEARAIIAILYPPAQRRQMMADMMRDLVAPMRQSISPEVASDPGLSAIIDRLIERSIAAQRPLIERQFPMLLEAMAGAYTRIFTLAELKDVHAFARTASGSKYLGKSTSILGDPVVMKVNGSIFAEANAAAANLRPAFQEEILAYLKANPAVAERIAAGRERTGER